MSEPNASIAPVEPLPPGLSITLFGPLLVLVNGQPIPHLRSRKAQWVLCLLTLRYGRPVQREWLAGTLWPDIDQTQAFANLRPTLSELRKALGSEGARLQSPSRNSLLLDLSGADVDVIAFDAAVAGKTGPGLERAVSLYQGSLLEGCTEEWVAQDREVRQQSCLRALQELATGVARTGNHEAAAAYWRRAVAMDPLWEAARRGLMEALIGTGDSNEALDVYRSFARHLRRDDPKATPDAETSALYTRLVASIRKRADSATVVRSETPTAPAVTGYLPHALTELVGREDERLEVAALLQRSRLVTLVGVGGIGKTRLAVAVAADVVGEYRDGVWLIALDTITDGTLVAAQIAGVLRLKETHGKPLLNSIADFLRGKRTLLVLDNCEHVLPASLEAAAYLLRECVGVRILATSREAMGISGETVWAVPPLAVPEPDHLPKGGAARRDVLLGYDSVKLFVGRAQAVQKGFTLTAENAPYAARLCASLEGIPLAIELAAGRVRALTLEQIARHLEDHLSPVTSIRPSGYSGSLGHLRLLTGGNRSAGQRQQTLRGTLDWSYGLLSEAERTLLSRTSVFAGSWDLQAAEEVCAGNDIETEDILDLLSSLADKSLVVFLPTEDGTEGRFRLLEIVRQYSTEKLSQSSEREPVRARHRDWYSALAEQARSHLTGPDQQLWLERLETEHDNLRAALEWCTDEASPQSADAGLRLASALWTFWEIRGYVAEGRGHLERALAEDTGQAPTLFRARTLCALSSATRHQGNYAAAQAHCEEALAIYQALDDLPGIADAGNQLGNIAYMQGHRLSAKSLYTESLKHRRILNDRRGIALTLNNLGNIADQLGDSDAATALFEESLQIRREVGDTRGIAYALRSLGKLANARCDYAAARVLHEEALRLRRELGDEGGVAESLIYLGVNALHRGDYISSLELFEQSEQMHRKLGDPHNLAVGLGNQAEIHYLMKNYVTASALYRESLSLRQELGDRFGIAVSLQGLGSIAHAQEDSEGAERLVRESLILFTKLEAKEGIGKCLWIYGTLNQEKQQNAKAARLFGAVEALYTSPGTRLMPAERRDFDRQIAVVRTVLGEDVFASEWKAGQALTWDQAAAYALE
ncbi:MAG: tetratricopeptide repeat protein [Akkermansiaceae bacterium]|nr:tetratricopeptide repeat protein [Armatimonadota bacterium]